jgi:hypothetical protein
MSKAAGLLLGSVVPTGAMAGEFVRFRRCGMQAFRTVVVRDEIYVERSVYHSGVNSDKCNKVDLLEWRYENIQ